MVYENLKIQKQEKILKLKKYLEPIEKLHCPFEVQNFDKPICSCIKMLNLAQLH